MAAEKDMAALSIPFTAGVVAAAAMPRGVIPPHYAALACSVALVLCLGALLRKDSTCIPAAFLFALLGIFSYTNASLPGLAARQHPELARAALEKFCSIIDETGFTHPDSAALIKALITGMRTSLPRETVEAFRASGASHILALSGLHLGIIYGIVTKMSQILGNSRSAAVIKTAVTTSTCTFYAIMTGAGPSIVRALLFIILNEMGKMSPGRRRRPLTILFTALLVQLCLNPLVIHSLGFQLSYLAMLGIFIIFPRLDSWYPREEGRPGIMRQIWESAALSLSCQAFTAPLVWLRFGTFPGYFLITNLIALPLTSLLIPCSALCISLQSLGICPDCIKGLCDTLAQTLIFCLNVIASL